MALKPPTTSPPVLGPPAPSQVDQPAASGPIADSPQAAYLAYTVTIGQTVPFHVNRAHAATLRIRSLGHR